MSGKHRKLSPLESNSEAKMKFTSTCILGVTAFMLAAPGTAAVDPPPSAYAYQLGSVGFGGCRPTGINDRGQIVGYFGVNRSRNSNVRAFVTGPNGLGMTVLTLGGKESAAYGINNHGRVVGIAKPLGSTLFKPFITDADGANIREFELVGDGDARDINDSGQVVGGVQLPDGEYYSYFTGPNATGITYLPVPRSSATAVNELGQVILSDSSIDFNSQRSFITGPNGIGLIELSMEGGRSNVARGLNDKGQVTGEIYFFEGGFQQYVTDANGDNLRFMGTLDNAPGSLSYPSGINNVGNIVGASYMSSREKGYPYPATVSDGTTLLNLNRLVVNMPKGVTLADTGGINRHNQIAASGTDGSCYIVCPNRNCAK